MWLGLLGFYLTKQGDFDHGIEMTARAIELSPSPPPWINTPLFYDHYHHGRYEEALAVAKGMDLGGDFRGPLFVAAACGQLGRTEEARTAIEEMRILWSRPVTGIRQELIERHGYAPRLADHLIEGLAKAGIEGLPK